MQLDFAKHNDRKKYHQSRQLEEEKNDMKGFANSAIEE